MCLFTQLCRTVHSAMWARGFVAFWTLYLAEATRLTLNIDSLHLHGKFGGDIPEHKSEPELSDPIDIYVNTEASKYTLTKLRQWHDQPYQLQTFNHDLYNVAIPGLNLTALKLTNLEVSGLKNLSSFFFDWRMAKNRFHFNVTYPYLSLDVTADLTHKAGSYNMRTKPHISVRIMDATIWGAIQYNIGEIPHDDKFFIEKADVHLQAKESLVIINIVYGLEELRYLLAGVFNNSLDDVTNAVVKEVIHGINQEFFANIKPQDITDYLYARIPPRSKLQKHLLSIQRV